MHCINDARTYMREHREIVQHCWKHAALNCESTARVLAAQSAVPPAPHAPALEAPPTPEPDAVTRANEELAALLQAISPHFNHLSEPLDCAEYISMDANLDDKIHPSCDTADILAEVAHQHADPNNSKAEQVEEEETFIQLTRPEVLYGLARGINAATSPF